MSDNEFKVIPSWPRLFLREQFEDVASYGPDLEAFIAEDMRRTLEAASDAT